MQISSNSECWFVRITPFRQRKQPSFGSPGRKGGSCIYPCGRRGGLSGKSAGCVCTCVAGGSGLTHVYGYRADWTWFLQHRALADRRPGVQGAGRDCSGTWSPQAQGGQEGGCKMPDEGRGRLSSECSGNQAVWLSQAGRCPRLCPG